MQLTPALVILAIAGVTPVGALRQDVPKPIFRGGVNLVTVAVVVQHKDGRPVDGLTREDFQVLDNGEPRAITDFHTEAGSVEVALLVDLSGSMRISTKLADARAASRHVLAWLDPARDHAALFGFDTELTELVPFTAPVSDIDRALDTLRPFGETSLYDAIAATGRRITSRGYQRRAVVAITDGGDTSSHMRPAEVASLASSIDVPVYIIAVAPPMGHPGAQPTVTGAPTSPAAGPLATLARATGGLSFAASAPAQQSLAARQIVADLRSQYVITFEPAASGLTGVRPVSVVTRNKAFVVRSRSGYAAGTHGSTRH